MADTQMHVDKYAVLAVPHAEALLKAIAERDGIGGGDAAQIKSFVQRHTSRAVKAFARSIRDAKQQDAEEKG